MLRRADRKAEFQRNNLQNFEYIQAIDGEANIFRHIHARPNWLDPFKKKTTTAKRSGLFFYLTLKLGKDVLN